MTKSQLILLSSKKVKTSYEIELLRTEITKLAERAKEYKNLLRILFKIFYPMIKSYTGKLFKKYGHGAYTLSHSDLTNQAYIYLERAVDNYKKDIFPGKEISFTHYVDVIIKMNLRRFIMDEAFRLKQQVASIIPDSQARDKRLPELNPFYSALEEDFAINTYKESLRAALHKRTHHKLNKTKVTYILNSVIFEQGSMHKIAKHYKTTYWSVYQTVSVWKYHLANQINQDGKFNYFVDMTDIKKVRNGTKGEYRLVATC